MPNPDKPELNIDDLRLKICGTPGEKAFERDLSGELDL
jgi:hypothetical protein